MADGLRVEEIGCIKSLELPKGWVRDSQPTDSGGRQIIRFHPKGLPQVSVCTSVRHLQLSRPAAETFQVTLNSDFHPLIQDELDLLVEVLEEMADPVAFQITAASTGSLNDKRVLRISGRWLPSVEDTVSCIIDVRGDGKIVQQLYYIAPAETFNDYLPAADKIFLSVKWHHAGDKPKSK